MNKNTLFFWEQQPTIHFKLQISCISLSEKHLFLATFSGSVFFANLDTFSIDLHVSFSELVAPIKKMLIYSDIIKEIRGFLATSSGLLYYMYFQYNEQFQIISEKTQMVSRIFENQQIIELLYSPVMDILVLASEKAVFYFKTAVEHEKNIVKTLQEEKIFETDEEIFQIDLSGPKLLVSTFKNYFLINIFSKTLSKLGTKEKQGFFGAVFLNIENEELAFAGRNQGFLWKIDAASGKVLTTLKFTDSNEEKLIYGKFISLNNGLLVSYDDKNLYIMDLKSKQLLTERKLTENTIILVISTQKKKKTSGSQKLFLINTEKKGEISLEIGKTVSVTGLFEQAILQKDLKNILDLLFENKSLQTMENLRKLEKMAEFPEIFLNEKVRILTEEIEKDWLNEDKIKKLDFFANIVRKEDLKILKERTKVLEKKSLKHSNENYFKISQVTLLQTEEPRHLKRIIQENYSLNKEKRVFQMKKSNPKGPEIIRLVNERICEIFQQKEAKVFRLEFREKAVDFLKINEDFKFKRFLWECLRFEDNVLLDFAKKYGEDLEKFREYNVFMYGVAGMRFERTLGDMKNAVFFLIIENEEVRILYKDFIESVNVVYGEINEDQSDFLEKTQIYLQK